jgi:DNA repair exonuclease SbcCD ATPase subunit
MTLDEAIKHCEELVEAHDKLRKRYDDASGYSRSHNEAIRTQDAKKHEKCRQDFRQLAGWLKELKELKAEQKNRIAEERYEDLVGYFGGDKTILESREEFQKWLARIKWHVKKCDELAREKEAEPCADAISRKAAIRWVKTECNPYGKPTIDFESGKKVIEHLKKMPSVTPKQKTGKWNVLGYDDPQVRMYKCSECHLKITRKFKFCPNCGAKMENQDE